MFKTRASLICEFVFIKIVKIIKITIVKINNLILLASYIDSNDDLSEHDELNVLSIFGDRDEIVTLDNIEESKNYLPERTVFKEITGGNHSQFGYYGFQNSDGQASISRERQHELIVKKIVDFLE